MTPQHLMASLALALCSATAFAHGDDHKPQHGGVVAATADMDYELVARADLLTLHLNEHGKPGNAQGASARITLLNGTDKTEVVLAPVGPSRLEAKGSFKIAPGTKAVALVTLPGKKPANVRFVVK